MKIRKIRIFIISMLLIGIITACFFENPLTQLQTKQAAQLEARQTAETTAPVTGKKDPYE